MIIRVMYGKNEIYQVHVLINTVFQVLVQVNKNLSGSCTEKADPIIRFLYGHDKPCAAATGYCGTIHCGTFYYGTITFDPSPSVIFIVPKSYCIPLIY